LPLSRLVSRQLRRRPSPGFARYPALREKIPNSDLLIQAHTANAMERAIDDLLLERHPVAQLVLQMEINGTEHLERALAAGRGVLLSSGHFFSSRLAKQVLTLRGWPVISIRNLTFDDPAVGRWAKLQLLPRYYHFLHRIIREEIDSKDPECTLKILARLRAGGIVDVHVDAPFRRNTHPLPFLGTSQWFPKGFLEIAHRNGTPVVPWLSLGNSRKLKMEFYPPLFPEAGSPVEILEQLVRLLEKQVVENPEQWEYTIRL
jgi:KDO2-lipid IV(A) lauroyltransferase